MSCRASDAGRLEAFKRRGERNEPRFLPGRHNDLQAEGMPAAVQAQGIERHGKPISETRR